jgi:hypothetical protein
MGMLHYNALALPMLVLGGLLGTILLLEALCGRHFLPSVSPPLRFTLLGLAVVGFLMWSFLHARDAIVHGKDELLNAAHPVVRWLQTGTPSNN